jgi:hypothetical protein
MPQFSTDPLAVSVYVTYIDIVAASSHDHMNDERARPASEKPLAKPEIIPPSRDRRQSRSGDVRMRLFVYDGATRRIYIARPGRLLGLMIVVLFGSVLVLLLGAVLIGVLLGGLLVAAAIIFGLLRGYFHRPR